MITFFDYLKLIAEEAVAQAPKVANEDFNMDISPDVLKSNVPVQTDKKGVQFSRLDAPPEYQGFMQYQQNMRQQGKGMGKLQDPDYESNRVKMEQMLGQNYQTFASMLQKNITDPKFVRFIQMGIRDGVKEDDIVNFSQGFGTCLKLIPTQSEIDIDKSLAFPMKIEKDSQKILAMLNGGQFSPGGPIVTCCDKKYVIDGHHRWSQLYCMNPMNQIGLVNMNSPKFKPNPKGAVEALKTALIGSVALGTYSQQTVDSGNLLTMGEGPVKQWILGMSPAAKEAFGMFAQQPKAKPYMPQQGGEVDPVVGLAQNWVWNNVSIMQQRNQPIGGASPRSFMPQTGDGVHKFMAPLQQGQINWNTQA